MRALLLLFLVFRISVCCVYAEQNVKTSSELRLAIAAAVLPGSATTDSDFEVKIFERYKSIGRISIIKAELAVHMAKISLPKNWTGGFEVRNDGVTIYAETALSPSPRQRLSVFFYFDADGQLTKCVRGISYDSL
jgi:hypothetical protein